MEFRLVPAIFGHLILPLVQIENANALIVRDASGRTNWDRDPNGRPPIGAFRPSTASWCKTAIWKLMMPCAS